MIKIIKFIWNIDDVFWPWFYGHKKWKNFGTIRAPCDPVSCW